MKFLNTHNTHIFFIAVEYTLSFILLTFLFKFDCELSGLVLWLIEQFSQEIKLKLNVQKHLIVVFMDDFKREMKRKNGSKIA